MTMMRRMQACACACWLVFCVAAIGLAQDDPELQIRTDVAFHLSEVDTAYSPCVVTITNAGPKRMVVVEVEVNPHRSNDASFLARRAVEMPPGEKKIEIPVYHVQQHFSAQVRFYVDGTHAHRLDTWSGGGYHDSDLAQVLVVGSGEEKIRDEIDKIYSSSGTRRGGDPFAVDALAVNELFQHWQSYLGWKGVLAINAEALTRLSMTQREAIYRWVCYGGGFLWVFRNDNKNDFSALERFSFPLANLARGTRLPCMTGHVLLSNAAQTSKVCHDLKRYVSNDKMRKAFALGMGASNYWSRASSTDYLGNLFESLHEIPRYGFIFISVCLAILIGPVNLYLLKRRRQLAWFYFTAPVLSLMGMLSLGAYSVLHDGLAVRGNELALLVHDLDSGRGAMYQARGMFAGMTPSGGLKYSAETAVVPFIPARRYSQNTNRYSVDWGGAQHLRTGWVNGRSLNGVMTVTPLRVRMGIDVQVNADGSVSATNNLTGTVNRLFVKVGDAEKTYVLRRSLAPGERATLTEYTSALCARDLRPADSEMRGFGELEQRLCLYMKQRAIVAEVEGLPHLDTGGLECERLSKRYYYIATNAAGGIAAAPEKEGQ